MAEVWAFRIVCAAALVAFGWQIAARGRLLFRAKNDWRWRPVGRRLRQVLVDVLLQGRTIRDKPVAGLAHAVVFWGFLAFAGYTMVEFLAGLGVVDLTGTPTFQRYARVLIPFAVGVTAGMIGLLVRRVVLRPRSLSANRVVSGESVVIGVAIVVLMVTFLLAAPLEGGSFERLNWWSHALVILGFLVLIPGSKHLHLFVSPLTVYLKAARLGTVPNLDFEAEEVGLETVGDLERKSVLDAFTCVECGRCQERCPALATGKALNPKTLILRNEEALLAGRLDQPLVELYDPEVLWQCTTCGACEDACPVGVEHIPLIVGARRGLTSNGEAPAAYGAVYNHLDRRGNVWGLSADQRQKFIDACGVPTFDPARHQYLVWLGCAGNFDAEFQRSLRALFDILRRKGCTVGVLAGERCTGDPAKRTGNEFAFQELATHNIEQFRAAGVVRIVTACPHCVKTLGDDYRAFGWQAEVVHVSVLLEELTRTDGMGASAGDGAAETVTFHDPCYLSRYGGEVQAPREVLTRVGGRVVEPARHGRDTFCCGAGGGLVFDDREESGTRISQERYDELVATGAQTVVTGCPFCSIMLKGAAASSGAGVPAVDLATYVHRRLVAGETEETESSEPGSP